MTSVVELNRKQYQDYELVFEYETDEHYAVRVDRNAGGFSIHLAREKLEAPVKKRFAETLFQPYLARPSVYAVEADGELVAFLEIDREFWIKRLRITDLMVLPGHRRRGYATMLVDKAKEIAEREKFRAIFLDTHSCNVGAIDFYLSQGFAPGAVDTTYYSNHDIDRREVWVGMVYLLDNETAKNWHYEY